MSMIKDEYFEVQEEEYMPSFEEPQMLRNAEFVGESDGDEARLKRLLYNFDMDFLYLFLKASDITYRSLRYLSVDDINTAIRSIGYRAEFREKLFAWRRKKYRTTDKTIEPQPEQHENEEPLAEPLIPARNNVRKRRNSAMTPEEPESDFEQNSHSNAPLTNKARKRPSSAVTPDETQSDLDQSLLNNVSKSSTRKGELTPISIRSQLTRNMATCSESIPNYEANNFISHQFPISNRARSQEPELHSLRTSSPSENSVPPAERTTFLIRSLNNLPAASKDQNYFFQQRMLSMLNTSNVKIDKIGKALAANMMSKNDFKAQSKTLRDCKALSSRIHHSMSAMTGQPSNEYHMEIAAVLPLNEIDAALHMEECLKRPEYAQAATQYVESLKGDHGDVISTLRKVVADNMLVHFNWDGRWGKDALQKLSLFSDIFFNVFKYLGTKEFERQMRKAIEMSHNRSKQKKYRNSLFT